MYPESRLCEAMNAHIENFCIAKLALATGSHLLYNAACESSSHPIYQLHDCLEKLCPILLRRLQPRMNVLSVS